MNEARDIVGISVPFAAGVAMGVALYPLLSGGLPFITSSILLVLICITTLLVRFGKLSDRSGKRLVSLSNQPPAPRQADALRQAQRPADILCGNIHSHGNILLVELSHRKRDS